MNARKETCGIISTVSRHSFAQSVERVLGTLAAKRIHVFALIDHAQEAEKAGLELRPTTVIIFGDPLAGTPLMAAFPSLAIDLPLKALIWQESEGVVLVACNSPHYLRTRHGLEMEPFTSIVELVLASVE